MTIGSDEIQGDSRNKLSMFAWLWIRIGNRQHKLHGTDQHEAAHETAQGVDINSWRDT